MVKQVKPLEYEEDGKTTEQKSFEESNEISWLEISKPKKKKWSKNKILFIVCVSCSLIVGLTATGAFINLAIEIEGNFGAESFLAERVILVPLGFILGFLAPLLAIPLFKVCWVID